MLWKTFRFHAKRVLCRAAQWRRLPASLVDYNFSIDNSAESKFGTRKELIVLNIL